MAKEDELFVVSCVACNSHIFKFSKNLLEEYLEIFLKCPKCRETTVVRYIDGLTISNK
jgi:phage FluMu protein Com